MKQQGPKQLAKVVDHLDSPRVQRYLIQRGRFTAWLTTTETLAAGWRRRGYTVEAVER